MMRSLQTRCSSAPRLGVDLAEQRRASLDGSSVRGDGTQTRRLADAATNLLVLGTREGRAGQSHRAVDGHAKLDTTLNVYTQVIDGSLRDDAVGSELFTIVHARAEQGCGTGA